MKKMIVINILFLIVFAFPGFCNAAFNQAVKLTASDGGVEDDFGYDVAVSGDYAIIGASYDDGKGTDAGAAYVYQRSGDTWVQIQKLTAGDGAAGDRFGICVSISGDYAAVGAYMDNDGAGSVYIFKRSGSTWVQQDKLTASDGASNDYFGYSTAISDGWVIVGAFADDDNGTTSGSAYFFKQLGDVWIQQDKMIAYDGDEGDRFGYAVSIAGYFAIVGARYDDANGTDSGSAYTLGLYGSYWYFEDKLLAGDGAEDDSFGYRVSIDRSGDYAIVGAPRKGNSAGAAYIFKWSGGYNWDQQAKLVASDVAENDSFGVDVKINGDYAVVGSPFDDDKGSGSGSVYIFERSGESWIQNQKLTAADGFEKDYFGYSVDMDGTDVIIGTPKDDDKGTDAGSAYIFNTSSSSTLPGVPAQYSPYGGVSSTTFTWSASSGATSYTIWVCDTSFTGVFYQTYTAAEVESGGSCSAYVNPAYFTYGVVYYWYICASNSAGDSWSWNNGGMPFWLTSNATTTVPAVPTQYSPYSEVSSTTFTWSASSGATSYSIWVCDASFTGVFYQTYTAAEVESGGSCSVNVSSSYFTSGQVYYWYICASNSAGDSWSWNNGGMGFWLSSTASTLPAVPAQYSPTGEVNTTTFTWSASSGATSYSIWICDASYNGLFLGTYSASEVESGSTCSTIVASSYFTYGQSYYWFVCASNSAGDSWNWSTGGMSFTYQSSSVDDGDPHNGSDDDEVDN